MDDSKQPMNMRVLQASTHRRSVDEIFVFTFREDEFYWGRVVSTGLIFDGVENVILCYAYHHSTTGLDPIPQFEKNHLLIPPFVTNDELWNKGYFETIAMHSHQPGDNHPTHCFKSPDDDIYQDEYGEILPGRMEPCGANLFHSCSMIDEALSGVLGFPISPLT